MNNFTKDELELTLSLYQEFMKKYEFAEDVEAIVDKLQSLIANYCEHENLKDVGKQYKVCRGCGEEVNE